MDVDEIIDSLHALPVSEFTKARNEAERELRKAGDKEQAAEIKALRKPTAGAAAVNRLVREHRAEVDAYLKAAAKLRDAQFAGKGDAAAAAQGERAALAQLVRLGGEVVRPTLQAAAVDDNTARDVLAARLVTEPEPAGFGTLLSHAQPTADRSSATARRARAKPRRRDDGAARKQLHEAEQALAAATAEEQQARRRWQQTQRDVKKAEAAVEKARSKLDRIRAR